MAFNFTPFLDLGDKLIDQFGRDATIRRETAAALPDAAEPWNPGTPTTTDFTVRAVFLDFEQSAIDGELIKQHDQKVLVAAKNLSIEPTDKDRLLDGTTEWNIIRVKTTKPGPVTIIYELQVRR